jgi:Tfp pilus assembly protein PilN
VIERIEVNLLPAEYRVHPHRFGIRREIVYPALFSSVIITLLIVWRLNLQSSITDVHERIAALSAEIQTRGEVKKSLDELRSKQTVTEQKITALKRIDVNRERWVRLQEIFTRALPEQCWLEAVAEKKQEPPVVDIKGKSLSFPEVAAYMSALIETDYVEMVDLSNIEQTGDKSAFMFNISCRLNPNAGMHSQ